LAKAETGEKQCNLPVVSFSEERAEVCAHEFTPRQAWVHKCIKCGELHIEYKEQTDC